MGTHGMVYHKYLSKLHHDRLFGLGMKAFCSGLVYLVSYESHLVFFLLSHNVTSLNNTIQCNTKRDYG